eukprot:gene14456-biopygen14183
MQRRKHCVHSPAASAAVRRRTAKRPGKLGPGKKTLWQNRACDPHSAQIPPPSPFWERHTISGKTLVDNGQILPDHKWWRISWGFAAMFCDPNRCARDPGAKKIRMAPG